MSMDLPSILAELKAAQEEFKQSERNLATAIFCQRVDKALDRVVREADNAEFEHLVVGILIVIGSFNDLLPQLIDGPLLTQLLDRLFRECARVVLDIKWQQCDKDRPSQQNFRTLLLICHQLMAPRGYRRFSVLQTLMDNPWTHPVLSMVMGSEEDNEDGEGLAYIQAQDPEILKLRVELMQQENCDEFALNLCTWCLKHPALAQDFVLRKTQFVLFHRLNSIDRLQEECQTMGMEDSVQLINSLLGREEHKELCTMLAQTFLVQNWIKPSDNDTKKELLQLWIKLQYQADQDQDRFIASLWAVAKVSHSTEQLLLFIDAVREQCGDAFLQFCLDLCVFAINVDKGCWEKLKESNTSGPNEEVQARKRDMAKVCEKISHIVAHVSPKVSFCCALTAFSMVPTEQSLQAVCVAHHRRSQTDKSGKSQCCSNCAADKGECLKNGGSDKTSRDVNVATLYEVERLCGTLRPPYLSMESDFSVLYSMCKQYLLKENGEAFKSALVRRKSVPSLQPVPAVTTPSDTSLSALAITSSGPSQGTKPNILRGSVSVSKAADTMSHVSNVLPQSIDLAYKGETNNTLVIPDVQKKIVQLSSSGVHSEQLPVTVDTITATKSDTRVSGQKGNPNAIQQLVLNQLSTDMVQTLLHLIESGQISAVHINHVLTKNPNMSLQALHDLVSQAKVSNAPGKPATLQPNQQHGSQQHTPQQQQQQLQMPVQLQQVQYQPVPLQQQQQKPQQAQQPLQPQEVSYKQHLPSQQYKPSHPSSDVPQRLQSTNLQPTRIMTQNQAGLRQQTPQQVRIAQQPAQQLLGQPPVANTTQPLPVRKQLLGQPLMAKSQIPVSAQPLSVKSGPLEQPKPSPSAPQSQILQGVSQIGSLTLPTLQLTSTGEIRVTQPLHVMTFRQPVTVQSSAGGVQNAQLVMQTSSHMLTHLAGGSVMSAQQQPHIVHLPAASVSFTNQIPKPGAQTPKLIPKAPGPSMAVQGAVLCTTKSTNQTPVSSSDMGNRHYSINNLLFTGEQQNSALSISLPDRLPEISVDSISDTLRALSDSSSVGGQPVPRVSMQLTPSQVSRPSAQGPTIALQPSKKPSAPIAPKQFRGSTKTAPKPSAAQVLASTPTVVSTSQNAHSLMATLASFSVPSQTIQASDQPLPSFSSLFSSNRSSLPLPMSNTKTLTTSATTVPVPTTSSAPVAPPKKKGTGQSRGQKKVAGRDNGGNKGSKKDKKPVTADKEEMMRLLKQAMSINIGKKEDIEDNVATSLPTPDQQITSLHQQVASKSSKTISSASAWMVDFPCLSSSTCKAGPPFQQSSQPGLFSFSTVPSYQPSAGVSQHSKSVVQTNIPAPVLSTKTTSQSLVAAPAPSLPSSVGSNTSLHMAATSINSQHLPSFSVAGPANSKLLNILNKEEKRHVVSNSPKSSGMKHVVSSVASFPATVQPCGISSEIFAAKSGTGINTLGGSTVHGSVRGSAVCDITDSAAVSGSVRHPSLSYSTSNFAVGGSEKISTVLHSCENPAVSYATWNPAVSYSSVKAAVTNTTESPVVADVPRTAIVTCGAWTPAVIAHTNSNLPATGIPKYPTNSITPAIPAVVYDTSNLSSGMTSSSAQNIATAPSVIDSALGLSHSGTSWAVQSSFMQPALTSSATSLALLANPVSHDGTVERNGIENKPFATYRCLICSKAFMTLDALRVHVKRNCKPASDQTDNHSSDGTATNIPSSVGGLETSTVFQCMRCFELCISEAGIRAHKEVCSKAPKPKPKPKTKPKSRAKPKPPKSEEEQATEARVMELLNKCLGEHREKLLQEKEVDKGKREMAKKKLTKRRKSVDGKPDPSTGASQSKNPKKENTPSISAQDDMPADINPIVPALIQDPIVPSHVQDKETPPIGPVKVEPQIDGSSAGHDFTAGDPPSEPSANVLLLGGSQAKEEKPTPKRKYYPKKKKAEVTAGSGPVPHPTAAVEGEPGISDEASKNSENKLLKNKKPAGGSNKQPSPNKPKKEPAPPRPRFKQLCGSGGRSFFKCLNCGQTLCSIENFNDHWLECIKKKPQLVKPKRITKEKKPKVNSSPEKVNNARYSTEESIDAVIQSVASGIYSFDVPEQEEQMELISEDLAKSRNAGCHPQVTSKEKPSEEILEEGKWFQALNSPTAAKTCELISRNCSEQSNREVTDIFEASNQASTKKEVEDTELLVDATQFGSVFHKTVSESSDVHARQSSCVPDVYTTQNDDTLGFQNTQPFGGVDSQTLLSSGVLGSVITHADDVLQKATCRSLSPQAIKSSAVVSSQQATLSYVLSSQTTQLETMLSSQITQPVAVPSSLTTWSETVLPSQIPQSAAVVAPQTTKREMLSSHSKFSEAALSSHTTQSDAVPEKIINESLTAQTAHSETVQYSETKQSDDFCKKITSESLVSAPPQVDPVILQKSEPKTIKESNGTDSSINVDFVSEETEEQKSVEGISDSPLKSPPSTPSKSVRSRDRPPKTISSLQQRSHGAPEPTRKSAERRRSNSAPKPTTKDSEKQTPAAADSETSDGNCTTPKSATKVNKKRADSITPKKGSNQAPDIKECKYCSLCDHSYSRHWVLVRHFAGKHVRAFIREQEDGTLYLCPFCYGVFPQYYLFKAHVMTHPDMLLKLFLGAENPSTKETNETLSVENLEQTCKEADPATEHSKQSLKDTKFATGDSVTEELPITLKADSQSESVSEKVSVSKKVDVQGRTEVKTVALSERKSEQSTETVSQPMGDTSEAESPNKSTVSSSNVNSPRKSVRKQGSQQVKKTNSKQQISSPVVRKVKESSSVKHNRDAAQSRKDKGNKSVSKVEGEAKIVQDDGQSVKTTESADHSKYCRVCQRVFSRNGVLIQHIASQHIRPYTVKRDGSSVSYCCQFCLKEYPNKASYMAHVPQHSKVISQQFNSMEMPIAVGNHASDNAKSDDHAVKEKAILDKSESSKLASLVSENDGTVLQERVSKTEVASKSADASAVLVPLTVEADISILSVNESSRVIESGALSCTESTSEDGRMGTKDDTKTVETPSDTNGSNCENSTKSSSDISVIRKWTTEMKEGERQEYNKNATESEDRTKQNEPIEVNSDHSMQMCDSIIKGETSVRRTASVKVSPLSCKADHCESIETAPEKLINLDKTQTSGGTVSVYAEADHEKSDESVQEATKTDKGGIKDSSESSVTCTKSRSRSDDTLRKKKLNQQHNQMIRKRRGALKLKAVGVQKRTDSHKRKVAKPQTHYCRVCQRSFCRNWVLAQHITSQHLHPYTQIQKGNSSSYTCHLCHKVFSPKAKFMYHVTSHANVIIEQFNSTESLEKVIFGRHTYKITRDASEMDIQKQSHTSLKDFNKGKEGGHEKDGKPNDVSMNSGPCHSASSSNSSNTKAVSSSPRGRRNSGRIASSQACGKTLNNPSTVQDSADSHRGNSKQKPFDQNSAENKLKQTRTKKGKTSNIMSGIDEDQQGEAYPSSEGVSIKAKKDKTKERAKSQSCGGKREEINTESGSGSAECKPKRTRADKAKAGWSKDVQEAMPTNSDQGLSGSQNSMRTREEVPETDRQKHDKDGESQKEISTECDTSFTENELKQKRVEDESQMGKTGSDDFIKQTEESYKIPYSVVGEGERENVRSTVSELGEFKSDGDDEEKDTNTEFQVSAQTEPKQAVEEKSVDEVNLAMLEKNSEGAHKKVVSYTESNKDESITTDNGTKSNVQDKASIQETDDSKASAAASEEGRSTEETSVDSCKQNIVHCGQENASLSLKRMEDGLSFDLSPLVSNPVATTLQKPSFLDSFVSFVSTRSPDAPLPLSHSRRRIRSLKTSKFLKGRHPREAACAKHNPSEEPAQALVKNHVLQPVVTALSTKKAWHGLGISEDPSTTHTKIQDSNTASAGSGSLSMTYDNANGRKVEEQIAIDCDRQSGQCTEDVNCDSEICHPLKSALGKDEQTSYGLGSECSLDLATCSGSERDCMNESVTSEPVPYADASEEILDKGAPLHCTKDAPAPQMDVQTNEESVTSAVIVSKASSGGREKESVVNSISSDVVSQSVAPCQCSELPATAKYVNSSGFGESVGQLASCQGASSQRKGVDIYDTVNDIPSCTTLTGILSKAIDLAIQQDYPVTVDSSTSILPRLFTESTDIQCSTPVLQTSGQPLKQPPATISGDRELSGRIELSDHTDTTKEPLIQSETISSVQDSEMSVEDVPAGATHSCSSPELHESAKEDSETVDKVSISSGEKLVSQVYNKSEVHTLHDKMSSVPELQNSSITPAFDYQISSGSVGETKEKSSVSKVIAVLSSTDLEGQNSNIHVGEQFIPDKSDSSHADNGKHPVSMMESLQKSPFSVLPVSAAPELSETVSEHQEDSLNSTRVTIVSGESVYDVDHSVEDSWDTSRDRVSVVPLSEDPSLADNLVLSLDKDPASEDKDCVLDHFEIPEPQETKEQMRSVMLCTSSAKSEEDFELEDEASEPCLHSATLDPSFSDLASVQSADVTGLSLGCVEAETAMSGDATCNPLPKPEEKEEKSFVSSTQNERENTGLPKTKHAQEITADCFSNISVKREKLSFDIDADSDLPDLCIEPDTQSVIVNTSMKFETKKAGHSEKTCTKDPRSCSHEVNISEKKSPYSAGKGNQDIVLSTVVGEYAVTVKKLQGSKPSVAAVKKTYCAKVEVKTDDVKEDHETDPTESPVRKPLLGLKSLRSVHQPEPFVWDVEGEEDHSKQARNERSLKAFQRQVQVAPFSWDVDGAEEIKSRVDEMGKHFETAAGVEIMQSNQENACAVLFPLNKKNDSSRRKDSDDAECNSKKAWNSAETNTSVKKQNSDLNEEGCSYSRDVKSGHTKSTSIDSDVADLKNSGNTDKLDIACQAKHTSVDQTQEDVGSNTRILTRSNKQNQNKTESRDLGKSESICSDDINGTEEMNPVDNAEISTKAQTYTTRQWEMNRQSRTLRSGSSDETVLKTERYSTSRSRRNVEPVKRKPFRKSQSCDIDDTHSVPGTHESSQSIKTEQQSAGFATEVDRNCSVTIGTDKSVEKEADLESARTDLQRSQVMLGSQSSKQTVQSPAARKWRLRHLHKNISSAVRLPVASTVRSSRMRKRLTVEMHQKMPGSLNIITRSQQSRRNNKHFMKGDKVGQAKFHAERSKSGFSKNYRKKASSKARSFEDSKSNSQENNQQMGALSQPNSLLGANPKSLRIRDKNSDKNDSQHTTVSKSGCNQDTHKPSQAEAVPTKLGTERKVLRSRDITPDKVASDANAASQLLSESESQKSGRTRFRRASTSSNQNKTVLINENPSGGLVNSVEHSTSIVSSDTSTGTAVCATSSASSSESKHETSNLNRPQRSRERKTLQPSTATKVSKSVLLAQTDSAVLETDQQASETVSNLRSKSKSPNRSEQRPRDVVKSPSPQQNLSAMVRRRQHPTSWHKPVSRPTKKRQIVSSQPRQYEIIRVEPLREDSASGQRRTRSSDKDLETSPRTVHTRVAVEALKSAVHDAYSGKAPCDQKWSINRHITPSEIRKRSADPHFPFSFKRARRQTDTK